MKLLTEPIRDGKSSRALLMAAAVLILLAAVGSAVDWHSLTVDGLDGALNDQVGYISVARDFADHGTLNSKIVYPLLLRQPVRRNSLYMPGYFWTLGAFFRTFGYSAVVARIPAILAFLLSCGLIYWIAGRLYGERSALFSVTLFAAAPLCLLFAFTAMMEIPLVAAGLAAFAIFLRSSERVRPWIAPITLVLPFLLRETGIIVGIIMLAVMMGEAWGSPRRKKQVINVCVSAVLMLVLCLALLKSPAGSGRPSLWKANVLIGQNYEVLYGDAFATDKVPSRLGDWADAIRDKFLYNSRVLVRPKGESAGFVEQSVLWFTLSGIPLGIFLGIKRRDFFAFGTNVAVLLLLLGCLALYPVWGYRALRVLLMLFPFVGILWSSLLSALLKHSRQLVDTCLVSAILIIGAWSAVRLVRAQVRIDPETRENTRFLESVVGNDRRMLVAPFWLSFDYINEHYPQSWAFVPSNCETMRLLDQRYKIGTMILSEPDSDSVDENVPRLPPQDAGCGTAVKFSEERQFSGMRFWVYRRTEK